MEIQYADSVRFDIFIAGDLQQARHTCRQWCMDIGACVTVEPVEFIYTGGAEMGVRVGLINYPRFPSDAFSLQERAIGLADQLMLDLCQHSYSVVGPDRTVWKSRRAA